MSPASSHTSTEIATQPDDWARAVARVPSLADVLPRAGERVATIGCGTSWFVGQAYAARREELGQGVTDAFAASEHHLARGYDRVVVISRSGTTSEVVDVVRELRAAGTPHVAFVATPGTEIAELAEHTVLMDDVDEESVVQTRFATTTLTILRAAMGENLTPAIDEARAVLEAPEAEVLGALVEADQISFVGRGWTVGLANEAALKLRESNQMWVEAYPAMEYRHGPISIAEPGRVVWAIGEVPEGLADDVAETGAHFEHRDADPMAELVRVHRLCVVRAAARGLDPDRPRNLSRSVMLES